MERKNAKPKLIDKGCWNCELGNKHLKNSRICQKCILQGLSKWRRKKIRKRGKKNEEKQKDS